MRKVKHVLIPIALVLAMLISAPASATEVIDGEESENRTTDVFVMEFLRQDEHAGTSNWSESTTIKSTISLFDAEENLTGIIYDLQTDGEPSGYVEIVFLNQEPVVKAYSYNGINAVVGLLKNAEYQIDPYSDDIKVMSLGALDYAIKDGDDSGLMFDLQAGQYITFDQEKMQTFCEAQKAKMTIAFEAQKEQEVQVARQAANEEAVTPYSTFEYVGGSSSISLVKMDDFSGYDNHCSPTAGTNVIKYYYDVWGINFYDSRDYTFERLYDFMRTNTTVEGTDRTKIIAGLRSYFNYYGATYDFSGTKTSPTLALIRTYIGKDCPVIMSVDDFGGTSGGHSIVAFGCMPSTSVVVSTGWDYALHTYTYSLLDVARLTYIGFDFASR